MISDESLFDFRIHAPVYAADALHEAHGIPMDVVVNHPRGVLKVQTFGEDVSRDEDADLPAALTFQLWGGSPVVVRRETLDDVSAVPLGSAVHLLYTLDAGVVQLALQIACSVGELSENEHLLPCKLLRFEQTDQL